MCITVRCVTPVFSGLHHVQGEGVAQHGQHTGGGGVRVLGHSNNRQQGHDKI